MSQAFIYERWVSQVFASQVFGVGCLRCSQSQVFDQVFRTPPELPPELSHENSIFDVGNSREDHHKKNTH